MPAMNLNEPVRVRNASFFPDTGNVCFTKLDEQINDAPTRYIFGECDAQCRFAQLLLQVLDSKLLAINGFQTLYRKIQNTEPQPVTHQAPYHFRLRRLEHDFGAVYELIEQREKILPAVG